MKFKIDSISAELPIYSQEQLQFACEEYELHDCNLLVDVRSVLGDYGIYQYKGSPYIGFIELNGVLIKWNVVRDEALKVIFAICATKYDGDLNLLSESNVIYMTDGYDLYDGEIEDEGLLMQRGYKKGCCGWIRVG